MIQTLMFFSLGFLTATLLTLVVIPLVHNRAERLTLRRLEASIPLSIAEVQVRKDELCADFAMATRRLEMRIERLTAKTASLFAELGKKDAVVNRLRGELQAKTAALLRVKGQNPSPVDTNDDFSPKSDWLTVCGPTLDDTKAEITRLNAELDARSCTADSQRIEIVALKIQIEALRDQVASLGKPRPQQGIETDRRRAGLRLVS
jgi:hypothetical protein